MAEVKEVVGRAGRPRSSHSALGRVHNASARRECGGAWDAGGGANDWPGPQAHYVQYECRQLM